MAKIYTKGDGTSFGGVPFGNSSVLHYRLKTRTDGSVIGSGHSAAIKQNDVVVLGVLPAGTRLDDTKIIVETGLTASSKGKLGFVYTDGVDDAATPQDDAYFGSDYDLATKARLAAKEAKLVVLPKDAYLTLTVSGANNAKAADIHVLVYGEQYGAL